MKESHEINPIGARKHAVVNRVDLASEGRDSFEGGRKPENASLRPCECQIIPEPMIEIALNLGKPGQVFFESGPLCSKDTLEDCDSRGDRLNSEDYRLTYLAMNPASSPWP